METSTVPRPKPKPQKYFYKEKFLLRLAGLSFNDNESSTYRIYSFLFIFLINISYPFVEFSDLFKHEFDVMADILIYEIAVFVTMIKTLVTFKHRIRFGKLMDKLGQPPFTPNLERGGQEEENIIKDCLWITSAQTYTYWICGLLSWLSAVGYTFIKRIRSSDYHDWQFAYGPLTILDVTRSPNYEISWTYQNLSMFCVGIHFITIDLMMAKVLAHVSFQFKVLQNYIRRSVENSYVAMLKNQDGVVFSTKMQTEIHHLKVDGSEIKWKYLKYTLKDLVEYHLAIIGVVKEVEELFSSLLLLIFLSTLSMICFTVYHGSLLPLNDLRLVRSLVEIVTMCLQVLTVCFWGEQVLFDSQEVGRAAFEANFTGTNLKFQKGLALIIRRSQYPTKLSAGNFSVICLATFTWIMRTSYSAFMVLHKNNAQERL